MDAPWRIEMLGGLRVRHRDRTITRFSTQKAASLLAYLAFRPARRYPREVLIEVFWPGGLPEAGRGSLRHALTTLRRQLEPPGVPAGALIQADRFAVGLNPLAFTTDTAEFRGSIRAAHDIEDPFERLTCLDRALSLYAGEFLSGIYDDWAIEEQRFLAELHDWGVGERDRVIREIHEPIAIGSVLEPSAPVAQPIHRAHAPLQITRFFGRQREIDWLVEHLKRRSGGEEECWSNGNGDDTTPSLLDSIAPRLITVSGFAGSGKTRLAIEAAERLAQGYDGRVWFVPLASLTEARQIPAAITDALGRQRTPGAEPLDQAAQFLSSAPSLLVLDNFEHLVESGADAVRAMLERIPGLALLVTSRRLLNLTGEQEYPLIPLPIPTDGEALEVLAQQEAVALFVDRAQHSRPDFQLTRHNAQTVTQICARLEGIPLAIELAAARAQVLTPAQILAGLENRLDFLVTRKRDVGGRHCSLKAAIDWSYGLLNPDLQRFFCRLSVFRGGWTVDTSKEVCQESGALLCLEMLHEASMVVTEEVGCSTRFQMLETLRQYAAEHLSEDEVEALRSRYVEVYLKIAEDSAGRRVSHVRGDRFAALDRERENLHRALEYSLMGPSGSEFGPRLAAALYDFWRVRGGIR